MDDIEGEKMTEQRFWGVAQDEDEDAFDYGRDVIREGNYDHMLQLPYK